MGIGSYVRKKSGSEWQGVIVGSYSTELTPKGWCVESSTHKGSVQIYPEKALEIVR
jgi:dihydrofolate reductase (trimethoprim resistance protein)